MPRRLFGSGFFALPSQDPQAYLDLVAFFGGDEAAALAYLAQLEAYAADGGEAQDLLDAAEAAGDAAAAIAILEGGGGPSLGTYASLQEVVDEITAAVLVEGQAWRIAWTGDAYIPDGEVFGTVRDGKPEWRGILPTPYVGATWTTISGTPTYDADGRPLLTATGAAPSTSVEIALPYTLGPASRVVAVGEYQSGTPSVTGTSGPAAALALNSDPLNARLISGIAYVSSFWVGLGSGFGNPFGNLSPQIAPATAKELILDVEILANARDAQPRGFSLITHTGNPAQIFDAATSISALWGDYRVDKDASLRISNTDLGVASSYLVTGIQITGTP